MSDRRGTARAPIRRRAVEILHAADVTGTPPVFGERDPAPALALVEGYWAHRETVDAAIEAASTHWTLPRMPVVDRNVLRVGVYELLHTDVPVGVVVNEAVEVAKLLSTEDSGRFVNGVLSRVARERRA